MFPLGHPEIESIARTVFRALGDESDRGAVLVAADVLDDQFADFFRAIAPSEIPTRLTKSLLSYPGALGTLAAKADIAVAVGLIRRPLYDAVTALRKLRNDAAHSRAPFSLDRHADRLTAILDLGPGVPEFIRDHTEQVQWDDLVQRAREASDEVAERDGTPLFETEEEILRFLRDSDGILSGTRKRHPRLMLALGVTLMCILLIHRKEEHATAEPFGAA